MANEENKKPNETAKKRSVTLRDLTASKNARVTGGAGSKPHAKLRDLTVPKEAHVVRNSGS
jgi:hypothetical protein